MGATVAQCTSIGDPAHRPSTETPTPTRTSPPHTHRDRSAPYRRCVLRTVTLCRGHVIPAPAEAQHLTPERHAGSSSVQSPPGHRPTPLHAREAPGPPAQAASDRRSLYHISLLGPVTPPAAARRSPETPAPVRTPGSAPAPGTERPSWSSTRLRSSTAHQSSGGR